MSKEIALLLLLALNQYRECQEYFSVVSLYILLSRTKWIINACNILINIHLYNMFVSGYNSLKVTTGYAENLTHF